MNKYFLKTFIALIILLASCQTRQPSSDRNFKDTAVVNKAIDSISLLTLDTAINLTGIGSSKYKGVDLDDSIAKKVLYNHFRQQGYFTAENLPDFHKLTKEDKNKLIVDFISIFKTNINKNEYADAIITYWLTPPYAIGNCWQPHKAIIVDTDNGYKITNEEFIPDNYVIDSVITINGQTTIFGYDYECANHKTLRKLRIQLK